MEKKENKTKREGKENKKKGKRTYKWGLLLL